MSATILYAEDDQDDFFLLEHSFQEAQLPFSLVRAPDGQQAIDYLRGVGPVFEANGSRAPQYIILDINMPWQNGFEVLAWARRHKFYKDMPIYILSSSGFPWDKKCAEELGASGFFVKSSDFATIISHFRKIAAEQQASPAEQKDQASPPS